MKIAFVHGHMFNAQTWSKARDILRKDGIELHLFSQQQSGEKAVAFLEKEDVDIFVGQLFHGLPWQSALLECAQKARARAGLGWDMPPAFSTFSDEQRARLEKYLNKISVENYAEGIKYLAACAGADVKYETPRPVQTHGAYHPDAPELFPNVSGYRAWLRERTDGTDDRPAVGILCYYGQVLENNREDIDEVVRAVEANGMVPLCVCSEGGGDAALPLEKRYPWLAYLKEGASSRSLKPAAIFNMMAGRLLSAPEDSVLFEELNVPVFQTIRLYHRSPEEWEEDAGGLGSGAFGLVYGLAQPEMAGVVEPTMVSGTVPEKDASADIGLRRYAPVPERIDHLCKRFKRWLSLRTLPNSEKRVSIVLNNNPCKGVKATLGIAVGLDTFESLARVIAALRNEGYDTGDAPKDGKAILDMFMERDAFKSDGEVFCQFLHLMGMRPVWVANGRVSKIEPAPLESLSLSVDGTTWSPRPRVDVVIQTSGILRDMVPHFADLLDEKWIENRKKHGYKGAGGVSSRVNNLYKLSATTRKVDKWVFDGVVETYVLNRENLEWLRTANPYALEELTRRLLEAESRGLREADPDMLEAVRQAALEIEGDMEEIMGEVKEEFQGGKVDVLTAADVDVWKQKWKLEDLGI